MTPDPDDEQLPPAAAAATTAPRPVAGPSADGSSPAQAVAVQAERAARGAWHALAERRGLRVALLGLGIALLGWWQGTDSALMLPLLLIGIVMVVTGSMGPRLRGRFAVDFGPGGTGIELGMHVAPPGRRATEAPAPVVVGRPRIALVPPPATQSEPHVDVVDSHGETIEIDVEELRAALADQDQRAAG